MKKSTDKSVKFICAYLFKISNAELDRKREDSSAA